MYVSYLGAFSWEATEPTYGGEFGGARWGISSDLRVQHCPDTNLEALHATGFQIRLASCQFLSEPEERTTQQALVDLATEGGTIIGRDKYIVNWVACVRMRGARTPARVVQFIRSLVKTQRKEAVD